MTGIVPENHYNYAAICVENLGQSGVIVTCQPLDLESFGAEGYFLILCSNKTSAIKCVRREFCKEANVSVLCYISTTRLKGVIMS